MLGPAGGLSVWCMSPHNMATRFLSHLGEYIFRCLLPHDLAAVNTTSGIFTWLEKISNFSLNPTRKYRDPISCSTNIKSLHKDSIPNEFVLTQPVFKNTCYVKF